MSSWLPTSVWPEFRDALQSLRVSPRCLSAAFAMILHSFCIRDTCTNSSVGFVCLDTRSCLLFRREGWGWVLLLGSGSCDLRFSEHFTWTRHNVSFSMCLLGFYMKLNQFWNVVSQHPFVFGVVPKEDFETQRQIRAKHQFPRRLASNEIRIFVRSTNCQDADPSGLTRGNYFDEERLSLRCATNGFGFHGEKFL